MSKHKFKAGDLVVLKENVKVGDCINGLTIFPPMRKDLKKPCCIKHVYLDGSALIGDYFYPLDALKPFYPEKIIIYRNGSEVIAKNTATGKTGVAKCNPTDEFDFEIGAKLAFDRLVESEPEKPKYYTGRVVCVHSVNSVFTKGKIYKVSDGRLYSNDSFTYSRFSSVESINKALAYKFIELVE